MRHFLFILCKCLVLNYFLEVSLFQTFHSAKNDSAKYEELYTLIIRPTVRLEWQRTSRSTRDDRKYRAGANLRSVGVHFSLGVYRPRQRK